jgi:hypothetical protein
MNLEPYPMPSPDAEPIVERTAPVPAPEPELELEPLPTTAVPELVAEVPAEPEVLAFTGSGLTLEASSLAGSLVLVGVVLIAAARRVAR